MLNNLAKYASIAWDFDGTLCGHHDADTFHKFIQLNPFNQVHHIVTFRTNRQVATMWDDFDFNGHKNPPSRQDFDHIINCPDDLDADYRNRHLLRDPTPIEDAYMTWKAKMCLRLGTRVLIDDMAMMVEDGCRQYGVDYLHPSFIIT